MASLTGNVYGINQSSINQPTETRQTSLHVVPSTLPQRIQQTQKTPATATYLQFQIQVPF